MEKLLIDLLKFETTEDKPDQLHAIIDYLDVFFNDYDVVTRRYEKNGKPSLVVTNTFTKSPKIFFNGHLDVVPAEYKRAFDPKIIGDKVYARGASDMKGTVTSMIYAFLEIIKSNSSAEVGLMLTTDEEIGGLSGVNYLLNEEEYSCEIAFVPDTGEDNWEICIGEKGVWFIEVECIGKSAHGARIWEGKNAINEIWKGYRDIRNEFIQGWGKAKDGNFWVPTVNVGELKGGDAYNVVPDQARAKLDFRFPAEIGFERLQSIVLAVLKKRNMRIVNEPVLSLGWTLEKSDAYIQSWLKTSKEFSNTNSSFFKSEGGSDARFFGEKGISVVMSRPRASRIHIENEWADLTQLKVFKDAIVRWVENL